MSRSVVLFDKQEHGAGHSRDGHCLFAGMDPIPWHYIQGWSGLVSDI